MNGCDFTATSLRKQDASTTPVPRATGSPPLTCSCFKAVSHKATLCCSGFPVAERVQAALWWPRPQTGGRCTGQPDTGRGFYGPACRRRQASSSGSVGRLAQYLRDLQGETLHFVTEVVHLFIESFVVCPMLSAQLLHVFPQVVNPLVLLVPQEDQDGDAHTGPGGQDANHRSHDHQRLGNRRHRAGWRTGTAYQRTGTTATAPLPSRASRAVPAARGAPAWLPSMFGAWAEYPASPGKHVVAGGGGSVGCLAQHLHDLQESDRADILVVEEARKPAIGTGEARGILQALLTDLGNRFLAVSHVHVERRSRHQRGKDHQDDNGQVGEEGWCRAWGAACRSHL